MPVAEVAPKMAEAEVASARYQEQTVLPVLLIWVCTKSVDVPEISLLNEVWMIKLLVPSQTNGVLKLTVVQVGSPVVGIAQFRYATWVRPVSNVVVNRLAVVCLMAML